MVLFDYCLLVVVDFVVHFDLVDLVDNLIAVLLNLLTSLKHDHVLDLLQVVVVVVVVGYHLHHEVVEVVVNQNPLEVVVEEVDLHHVQVVQWVVLHLNHLHQVGVVEVVEVVVLVDVQLMWGWNGWKRCELGC